MGFLKKGKALLCVLVNNNEFSQERVRGYLDALVSNNEFSQ